MVNQSVQVAENSGLKHVFNAMMIFSCILVAVFVPQIGQIVSWFGTICGLALVKEQILSWEISHPFK